MKLMDYNWKSWKPVISGGNLEGAGHCSPEEVVVTPFQRKTSSTSKPSVCTMKNSQL